MKRTLFSLYGFAFFNKLLLLSPVYAIFMLQNGLTDFQLSTMFIVSACGTILGQVPITFITNRLGQRWAMILGQFLKIVAILLWLIMPNYAGFATGMVLWGIQAGFRSVAFEGLLYDAVASYKMTDEFPRVLGRKSTYESIGTALSACGSLLMFMGYTWVTWVSVLSIVLSIVCLLMMPRLHTVTPLSVTSFRKLWRTGVKMCLRTPCLMPVMIFIVLVVNIPYLDDFLSPIGLQLGIPTEYVGILSFFLLGCATLGQRFAYKFNRLSNQVLYALVVCVGILYICFSQLYSVNALWMMGLAYSVFYGVYTLIYAQFQDMIPPQHRSVILSLYTTLIYVAYMVMCGIIGLGASLGSWRYGILIQGVLEIALGVWAWISIKNRCDLTLDIDD